MKCKNSRNNDLNTNVFNRTEQRYKHNENIDNQTTFVTISINRTYIHKIT